MGTWKLIKKVKIDNAEYHVTSGSGFPCYVTSSYTFINADNILQANIKPKKNLSNGKRRHELIYKSKPIMVVFSSYKAPDMTTDVATFNQYFLKQLKWPYVIGVFNHSEVEFQNGMPFMDKEQCFSIALFDISQDEAIDFAVSYVARTKRIGALIVGKALNANTITIMDVNYLSSV